jgi:hypothetical protein
VSHSAKRARHTVRRQSLFLPSTFSWALSKVVCRVPENTWQRKAAVTAPVDGDNVFAECLVWHLAKNPPEGSHVSYFAECLVWYSAKRASLPSARAITLSNEPISVPRSWFFAECYGPDTRQITSLPSVTLGKVTSTHLFICFPYSIQTNKRYFTDITYIHHRSSQTYIANTNSINTNSDISIQHKLRGSQHKQY